jgi:hypothetical protein
LLVGDDGGVSQWDRLSGSLTQQVVSLSTQVVDLTAKLAQNSGNSSLPHRRRTGCDETTVNVAGNRHRLQVARTELLTAHFLHKNRGPGRGR